MTPRVAASSPHRARVGLAARAPAALHRRHQRQAGELIGAALSAVHRSAAAANYLPWAPQRVGYVMLDLIGASPTCALRPTVRMDHSHAGGLQTCGASGAMTDRCLGAAADKGEASRTDRGDRIRVRKW